MFPKGHIRHRGDTQFLLIKQVLLGFMWSSAKRDLLYKVMSYTILVLISVKGIVVTVSE